ncbi:hypothetical protein BKA56DRAFT_589810 [Ilyonectria sp. MPI-CAGE-AT-0026]|nr:hypothetical protein BKA56DRAFT_589810 [Ilyonectria sp. MPI-CAGE-AT-0026]
MDMHHYLPQEYLQAIWHHMTQNTKEPELATRQHFRDAGLRLCSASSNAGLAKS